MSENTVHIDAHLSKAEIQTIINGMCINLDYQVYETDYASEYSPEIKAGIAVLRLIGETKLADEYQASFEEAIKEHDDE